MRKATRAEILAKARARIAEQVQQPVIGGLRERLEQAIRASKEAEDSAEERAKTRFKNVYHALQALTVLCQEHGIDGPALEYAFIALTIYEVKDQDEKRNV